MVATKILNLTRKEIIDKDLNKALVRFIDTVPLLEAIKKRLAELDYKFEWWYHNRPVEIRKGVYDWERYEFSPYVTWAVTVADGEKQVITGSVYEKIIQYKLGMYNTHIAKGNKICAWGVFNIQKWLVEFRNVDPYGFI